MEYLKTEHQRFKRWIDFLQYTPDTFKLQTAELDDQDLERILELEYKPTIDAVIDKESKPYFIEMSAIVNFKFYCMANDFRKCYAIMLGYENEYGIHSTEMIYLTDTLSRSFHKTKASFGKCLEQ